MKRSLLAPLNAIHLALLCILSWSFLPIVARFGQNHMDSFQFLFWTNLLSMLVVVFTLNPRRCLMAGPFCRTFFINTAILGFLGCFFYYLCLYYGYAQTRATEVLIIQYLWPGLTALLAVPLLGEKLTFNKLLGIGFGLLSALLVITQGHFGQIRAESPKVLGIVFLGALGFALFSVLSKKTPKIYPNLHVFMFFFWATVFSAAAMGGWSQFQWPSQDEWLPLGLNGALINGLSYLLWIKALNQAQASRIAPLVYLAPVLSVCWITFWFDESFKTIYLVAISLAIISGILVAKPEKSSPVTPLTTAKIHPSNEM